MNEFLKLQVRNDDSWRPVNLIPLATLNVSSHFQKHVCGCISFPCQGVSVETGGGLQVPPSITCRLCFFVFVLGFGVLRQSLSLSLELAGGQEQPMSQLLWAVVFCLSRAAIIDVHYCVWISIRAPSRRVRPPCLSDKYSIC